MELTVQNVYGLLLRSKLLSVDEAKAMFARWQEEARDASTNLVRFAAWMVANKYLTEYQATLLARGHADGFFLDDYKILDRLGKGRMAGVYKGQYRLGQVVAIKVLPPSKARDPILLARFQREAKLAMRLKHPNIVRSFQMGSAEGLHYLVMEYLEGETLEDVLARRRQFPPAEAVRLIYQTLQGLQHIHERSLVHRDLKPSNLMLVPPPSHDSTMSCTVKILDIGLGRALFDDGPEPEKDGGLTSEGVLLGTPDYMAPEQARDPRSTDIRADIYSLGCVLYHLLTGQPPFPDTNIISQMIKHATEPARPLRELNKDVPDGLQQIINWMMAKEPAGRYPTPERAASALEVFLAAGSATASSPDLDPQMQPYLAWVEAQNNRTPVPSSNPIIPISQMPTMPVMALNEPAAKPASGPLPAAKSAERPVLRPDSEKRERGEKAGKRDKHASRDERRRARKQVPPPPVPREEVPPPPVPKEEPEEATYDVELVPLPPSRLGERIGPGDLTRRDFVMFFAGVGVTVLAFLAGWGLAGLLRRSRDRAPEADKE